MDTDEDHTHTARSTHTGTQQVRRCGNDFFPSEVLFLSFAFFRRPGRGERPVMSLIHPNGFGPENTTESGSVPSAPGARGRSDDGSIAMGVILAPIVAALLLTIILFAWGRIRAKRARRARCGVRFHDACASSASIVSPRVAPSRGEVAHAAVAMPELPGLSLEEFRLQLRQEWQQQHADRPVVEFDPVAAASRGLLDQGLISSAPPSRRRPRQPKLPPIDMSRLSESQPYGFNDSARQDGASLTERSDRTSAARERPPSERRSPLATDAASSGTANRPAATAGAPAPPAASFTAASSPRRARIDVHGPGGIPTAVEAWVEEADAPADPYTT